VPQPDRAYNELNNPDAEDKPYQPEAVYLAEQTESESTEQYAEYDSMRQVIAESHATDCGNAPLQIAEYLRSENDHQ
jgi:hypothetical protein